MLTQEIRRKFLNYFKNKQHAVIASSPVVPHDDPTLLFINAGMNQFKDVFLGKSERDYKRAATSQKCIRVGGKHNDLENVGHTRRHLTLFEMLGNFSFGDYFKKEAIAFAWEVSTEVFGFDPNRIWPTVFREDDEAFELWTQYVPASRITRFDEKDNFWEMGDTGPCGPCSELYFDRGPKYGPGASPAEDIDGDRYLEFWNLVFMQYNRGANRVLTPLPKPSIDTGSGLERVISLIMDVDSVYETDVLRSLIEKTEEISDVRYDQEDKQRSPAFRVIADHLRCLAFAIADGVQPSNVDRGYVLRKVLRRAVRYGRMIGLQEPFLAKIFPRLCDTMGSDYPELEKSHTRIVEILTSEEEAFLRTLRRGGNILSQVVDRAQQHGKTISGDDAFKLKDTYGFPIEEILLIAKDANLQVDAQRYEALEEEAKERSRSVQKVTQQIASESVFADTLATHGPCRFLGYNQTAAEGTVIALVLDGVLVKELAEGQEGLVVLNQTPFYAEMGGQVGDMGILFAEDQHFVVDDCRAPFKGIIAHAGKLTQGTLRLGDKLQTAIDEERRKKITHNHTATHLLHWALHEVLGEHIKQAGSVVDPARLRFDFSHHKALSTEEIRQIEDLVNEKIRADILVNPYEIPYEEAQRRAEIKQFFGDKYGSVVRVVDIDFSKELCGGTHTSRTGTIGYFRIVKEGSIAAGIRRIEAQTGREAELFAREFEDLIAQLAVNLKVQPGKVTERIEKILEEQKALTQDLKILRKQQLEGIVDALLQKVETIKQMPVIAAQLALTAEELKSCAEDVMSKLSSGIVVLGSANEDKCQLFVRISDDLVGKGVKANELLKALTPIIDGSGGGKPNSAQAGGKAPQKLGEALAKVRELI